MYVNMSMYIHLLKRRKNKEGMKEKERKERRKEGREGGKEGRKAGKEGRKKGKKLLQSQSLIYYPNNLINVIFHLICIFLYRRVQMYKKN